MLNDKLSKREDEVMNAVFTLANGKESFLVAPCEILALLSPKSGYDEEKLERVLRALELDGYFELTLSERKGEKTYVIHLRADGLAYKRTDVQRKRGLMIKIAITVGCAVLSFLIGVLLKAIFS